MGEHDLEMGAEAGPSTPDIPSLTPTSPLTFDLAAASCRLCSDIGITDSGSASRSGLPDSLVQAAFADDPSKVQLDQLFPALSHLAAQPGIQDLIVRHYGPVLLQITSSWLEDLNGLAAEALESRLFVVASLAATRPDMWSYICAFISVSPFCSSPLACIPAPELGNTPSERLQPLLLSYNRLLTADPSFGARNDWSLDPLHALRNSHPDLGVRMLAIQVLAKLRGWSEVRRMEIERENVGAIERVDVPIFFGWEILKETSGATQIQRRVVDGWLLPLIESQRIENCESDSNGSFGSSFRPGLYLQAVDFLPRIALVADSLLLRSSKPTQTLPQLQHVSTSASDSALQSIVPQLQLCIPLLITSPSSSGKTHLLHYLSSQIFPDQQPTNRILTIPLADTTIDVKSLIGTYISSPTKPGSFEWMEGALAKAVRAGRWVVFDDIDRASTEMLVTISGLSRSLKPGRAGRRARLAVPGREDIEAGADFALFATRTVRQDAMVPPSFLGHHNFIEVSLDAPSNADILAILSAGFPRIPTSVVTTLVGVWQDIRPLSNISGPVKGRDIGLRDLEKWCARVERSLPSAAALAALEQNPAGPFANPVLQDEVLLEAADTFMAWLDARSSSADRRADMIRIIAERIGMDEERAFALLDTRRPQLEVSSATKQLRIGRTTMPIYPSPRRQPATDSRPFALTKPSLILLERIAATASMGEPTLLVGETGTGKTTAVQHISATCRKPLTVLNLSTQTESSDLLGGFKPIDAGVAARVLHTRWQQLFGETFSMAKAQNGAYLEAASKALSGRKWARLAELWGSSARRAVDKLTKKDEDPSEGGQHSPRKRRKVNSKVAKAGLEWQSLLVDIADFDLHHVKMKSKLVFSFVEGPLVKALRDGEWLLLDEVNLASQETLEAIATLLEGTAASLVLTERGDVEPIPRHPDFRLFACMNPATDVGKKDLPPNLRARFTELYVPPPDDDREALTTIVAQYLGDASAGDRAVILDIVEMYSTLKRLSAAKEIVDGSNTAPHFSMRTLARALMFAVETAPIFGLRRGLWEGCLMAFTMSLDVGSSKKAHDVCERYILSPMKNARAVLSQIPSLPASADADDYVRFGPFWLKRGPMPPMPESRYIITPSVQSKLSDLARVILTHRYPVLIQGPTSAGKTSAVEFLARQTGHRFVRINNHEHTDIQEYLGTYVTDPQTGNLVFQEGLLVTAVRQGHWIVLDELNLAPTDVLEALNRLLDDNRELVIPETQEVIKPHPNFILFATQNPPGLYAGRKVLSRAFRNRFLEVHFDDVPKDELETILCQRCQIAPSYAKKIVQVFEELRHRRQASRVFESKSSFATLRDLFRWAERGAVGYQQLAEDGYMLLAERARANEDKVVIKQVIEDIMKVSIDDKSMYRLLEGETILARLPFDQIPKSTMVWTNAMQRLFTLVANALAHKEPVLLVGETGCGKTSICEVVSAAFSQTMIGVNCHQNMETADLLGSQRPVRNRHERRAKVIARLSVVTTTPLTSATDDDLLNVCQSLLNTTGVDKTEIKSIQREIKAFTALFEWSDGPLVHAMSAGDLLLLDEVSLADDSVLERLNSVLEPGRTLVLAEKGGTDIDEATLVANDNFHVVATMNPGGDFGKKELSPALRNRFTEIWVPPLDDRADLLQIIGQSWKNKSLAPCGAPILDFFGWFGERIGDSAGLGLRDILAWVNFSDTIVQQGKMETGEAFRHGGEMVLVDGLESLPQVAGMSATSVAVLRQDCLDRLSELGKSLGGNHPTLTGPPTIDLNPEYISIGGFAVKRGTVIHEAVRFRLEAPTTALNAMRVLRGCQLPKAILLEGSPGVGKTSLVSALAALAGHHLQRINLSDQSDLIDLFGSDLPVEGGSAGEFQWRDAAFLDAMQKGDWVLLDEMNLASQTVLEGLNAVLDYRGTVFIPELGRSFVRHPDFRVFAAQNPLQQGGGRKGLPKSFLNRFTKVYLQEHTPEDLLMICKELNPMSTETVQKMIQFNEAIRYATMVGRTIGTEGSPWEFNLRDLFRWFSLLGARNGLELSLEPVEHLHLVYTHRFRNQRDRAAIFGVFTSIFGTSIPSIRPTPFLTPSHLQIGHSLLARSILGDAAVDVSIQHEHLDVAESVLKSIEMGWLVILAGDSGIGKRGLVRSIADSTGRPLGEFAMHPGVDTSEILGSFEQQDFSRIMDAAYTAMINLVDTAADVNPDLTARRNDLKMARDACLTSLGPDSTTAFLQISQAVLPFVATLPAYETALSALRVLEKANPASTGFAWSDGTLLKAVREGGWYLISNANLCNASVLDRLNSLCEHNGVIVLSEKGSETGSPEVIKPHPDFRLFMTFDPKYGELSRAMRNRGVELYMDRSETVVAQAEKVKNQSLAEHSLLRRIRPAAIANGNSSVVANEVAVQSSIGEVYLRRLAANGVHGLHISSILNDESLRQSLAISLKTASEEQYLLADFATSLPLDITVNPQIHSLTVNALSRSLQVYLHNAAGKDAVNAFLLDQSNNKSVLALSAAAARRGPSRNKKAAGSEIYPFVTLLRGVLAEQIGKIVVGQDGFALSNIEGLERMLVLLGILEDRAKSHTFDYSSTQLLAQWLKDIIVALPQLNEATQSLAGLADSVEISTGRGQSEIWAIFRRDGDEKIDDDLRSAVHRVRDPILRNSLLQALVAKQTSADFEVQELQDLLRGLPEVVAPANSQWFNWGVLASVELHALSALSKKASASDSIRLLTNEPNVDLLELVDLKSLSSIDPVTPSVVFDALSSWLHRAWSHPIESQENAGPGSLFTPASLISVLRFSAQEKTAMAEIPQQEEALKFSIDSVLWRASQKPNARLGALQMAANSLIMLLSAFGVQAVHEQDMPSLAASLADSSLPAEIRTVWDATLAIPVKSISAKSPSLRALGDLWVGIAQFLLGIYVTNIPIDPAVRRILLGEVLASRLSLLEEELAAVKQSEIELKGTSESRRTADVQSRLNLVAEEQSLLGPSAPRSADAVRLNILFSEVHSFVDDAMDRVKLEQLADSLKNGENQALKREDGFQAISGSFVHRLQTNYDDLADLSKPIITAVLFAKFGFRCLSRALQLDDAQPSSMIVKVLSFPTATVSEHSGNILSQVLSAASLVPHLHTDIERYTILPTFVSRLDDLYATWSSIRLREQQDAQDADSLYRVRKTDEVVLSDIEQEEQEFKELFPSFEGVADEDNDLEFRVDEKRKVDKKYGQDRVLAFHRLITAGFGVKDRAREVYELAVDEELHRFNGATFDESLDDQSLAFQVQSLHKRRKETSSSPVTPNFYLSPNEPEIRHAHSILSRIAARLQFLLSEWPEQMVLQHILDRVERISALDLRSPVAMILSALEGLLVHTDDWEAYANKENSLKSFQDEISALIISWRRLELASWMRLLDDQESAYIDRDSEWTLRLYGALIHGSINASTPEEHVKTVLPLLNNYLSSSTFGQFIPRLDTLRAFAKLAQEISTLSPDHSSIMIAIATMLHNVIANANLFGVRITADLGAKRAVLDKTIKDFVRLASWKDINVYALKASAVKSHRQLHKSIRKFREALSQPVSPILADLGSICPQDPAQTSTPPAFIAPDLSPPSAEVIQARGNAGLPDHLARLDTTFARYSAVLATSTKSASERISIASDLDTLAVEVIETIQALQKATPSSLTEDNKKIVNNLASRKRKAFSDLLKALRASGFSNNVRADALEKQKNASWLAARPALEHSNVIDKEIIGKIEGYHARLGVLMLAMRESFNGHNDDVNSQDLQRGMGFVESVYATSLSVRDGLADQLHQLTKLSQIVDRTKDVSVATSVAGGSLIRDELVRAEVDFRRLNNALIEVEEGVRAFRDLQSQAVSHSDLASVQDLRGETEELVAALTKVNKVTKSTSACLFTEGETGLAERANALQARYVETLSSASTSRPELDHLYGPVADIATGLGSFTQAESSPDISESLWKSSDNLIQKLLVVVQQLKSDMPETNEEDRVHVPSENRAHQAFVASLRITSILQEFEALITRLSENAGAASSVAPHLLARVLPFVESLSATYASTILRSAYDTKSTYKLCYVLARVMLDLAQKGYCKPSEQDDSKDGGEGSEVEGTGMGTGSGDKNVSNEITEESQVEGLQGEEEEEGDDEGNKDEDDAVSMDDDFAGDMGEGKEKEGDEEGSDEEEEEDHDEQVGDVDPLDPGAVDEKFWGDEKQEEKDDGGREDVMEQGQEEQGETELSAKEKEKEKEVEKKEEKKDEPEEGNNAKEGEAPEQDKGEEGEGEEIEGEEQDGEMEEQEEQEGQAPVQDDVAMPEGDKLDLPEELNFEEEDEGLDDDLNLDDAPLPEDDEGEPERENDDVSMADDDDGDAADDAPPAMEPTEEESNEPDAQLEQNLDVSAANDSAQEMDTAGGGQGAGEQEKEKEEGEEGEDIQRAEDENEADPAGQGAAPKNAGGPSGDQDMETDGPVDSSGAPLPSDSAGQPQKSMGDIMKEIRRRRDEILNQQTRDTPVDQPNAPQEAGGQVEHIGEEDQSDDQALGKAGEEERQKLADLNIVDEEDPGPNAEERHKMEDDLEEEGDGDAKSGKAQERSIKVEEKDERSNEKALMGNDIGGDAPTERPDEDAMQLDDPEDGVDGKREIKDEEDEGEVELNEITKLDGDVIDGETTWRHYAALTSDLSYALCEQLRLILEPTLATRLQGDFRTGKRLNMRKIIPYIASEYTKDKIWLRRTKPSRREYQVLLSLDDSRSMADSHSVHLAYQTLALVGQAMNKLEVGQVAIAKFGESVDILHPFGTAGFTDNDGKKVMGSFKFDQHRTDVVKLVERTLAFMAESRQAQTSGSPDLWQLQIIISDGVCQDHGRLRTLLRKAMEERVMIVFIIIDSLSTSTSGPTAAPATSAAGQGRPSILSMQTVEYKNVGGEMQLEMTRYLDTFPFEFFVVLRDVEALPGVLSDTLRQWMARVSQSQE